MVRFAASHRGTLSGHMIPIHPKSPVSSPSNDIFSAVRHTIAESNMIAPHENVLVGVSGGMDSVALLHVLLQLVPALSVRLGVAHLNHGLRGKEADRDAEFVASLAHRLQLPFHGHVDNALRYQKQHRVSLEEAARRLRYAFFDTVCAQHGYQKVALGHHADDNAELILMQLIRGAGMASLAGIPPIRDATIVRPFIRLYRQQIADYCRSAGISFVTDQTNFDRRFLRNRIRHELIPALRKDYNPAVVQSLNRLSDIVREELRWTDDLCEAQFRLVAINVEAGRVVLSLNGIRHCPIALRRRIIRKTIALVKGDIRRIAFVHIDAVLQLIAVGPDGGCLHLPDRVLVRINGSELIVARKAMDLRAVSRPAAPSPRFSYTVRTPSTQPLTVFVPEAGVRVVFSSFTTSNPGELRGAGQQQAFFDMDKLQFPMTVRNAQAGDRFSPLGAGGTQKVKKYFIDHKVPEKQRANCPLLVSAGQIVWLVGHRIAETAKVTLATDRVLKAEVQVVKL
jgi:tRNA(Ile)-lysidine synthase